MSLIGIYGYIVNGLTFMLISKNVNSDVTMNPPIAARSITSVVARLSESRGRLEETAWPSG